MMIFLVAKAIAAWVALNAVLGLYLVARYFVEEWQERAAIRRFESQGRRRVGL